MNIYDFVNFGFLEAGRDIAGRFVNNAIEDELVSREPEEADEGILHDFLGKRARNRELAKRKMTAGKSKKSMGASLDNLGKLMEDAGAKNKLSDLLRDVGGRMMDSGEELKDEAVDIYDRNTSRPLRWLHKLEGKEMTYGDKAAKNRELAARKKDILNRYRDKQVENKAKEFEDELSSRDAYRVRQQLNKLKERTYEYRLRRDIDNALSIPKNLFI